MFRNFQIKKEEKQDSKVQVFTKFLHLNSNSPGIVLQSPRLMIFLSRMRRPLLSVLRNCVSSSFMTSFTISGSFLNSGKASPCRFITNYCKVKKEKKKNERKIDWHTVLISVEQVHYFPALFFTYICTICT